MSLYKIILALLALAAVVAAETNADRFRRGLPPLAPRKGSRTVAGAVGGNRVRRSIPSCLAIPSKHGIIQITNAPSGGIVVGYLGESDRGFGVVGMAQATEFDLQPSLDSPFWIEQTSPSDPDYAYLGGAGPPGQDTFAAGSYEFAYPANVALTAGGTPPTGDNSGAFPYPGESTIWTIDCVSLQLTATWINPDGSPYPAQFANLPAQGYMIMGGDVAEFGVGYSVEADQVYLFFQPQV